MKLLLSSSTESRKPPSSSEASPPPPILVNDATVSVYANPHAGSLKRFLLEHRTKRSYIDILKDITFSAEPGDRVGVVGLNGSGKTTLIKMLAGILPLSKGTRVVRGHVCAVMATGLGLDGEYDLSTNIKLGMSYFGALDRYNRDREEIILEFAGLPGKNRALFKTLSSGFQARLAFSILLHLDSDVLLIDEILATGDQTFVQKSREAMLEYIGRSRVTVYVSHSATQIKDFCNRGIVLSEGRIAYRGGVDETVEAYQEIIRRTSETQT